MQNNKLVRFDWAIQYLLRDKANFDILEGFLSAILAKNVRIIELLESESNQKHKEDKFNRVDLLVEISWDEVVLIEVQVESELNFFRRIVYGTSKLIVENMDADRYKLIKKAISISITYLNLGSDKDYLYHGSTNFVGVNVGDTLGSFSSQTDDFSNDKVRQIFPEHYIIQVEKFNNEVKNAVDEWIYMLKNREVKPEFESRNIQVASEKLKYVALDEKKQRAYKAYMENERYHNSMIWSSYEEGRQQGLRQSYRERLKEGSQDTKIKIIKDALQQRLSIETIAEIIKLEVDDVRRIKQELMQS